MIFRLGYECQIAHDASGVRCLRGSRDLLRVRYVGMRVTKNLRGSPPPTLYHLPTASVRRKQCRGHAKYTEKT